MSARYEFSRKPPTIPTRFLFVGNITHDDGSSLSWLHPSSAPLVECVQLPQRSVRGKESRGNYVFLVCKDEAAALLIKDSIEGKPSNTGAGFFTAKFVAAERCMQEESSSDRGSSEEDATQHLRTYFDAAETAVPGLYLIPDYISKEEEEALMLGLGPASSSGWIGVSKRKVQHFGYRFDYATRFFSEHLGPLPPLLKGLAERISREEPLGGTDLDQMTANDYPAGAGMAPHIDTHMAFTGPVVSLSLGSHCTMEFKEGPSINAIVEDPSQLPKNPRSLLLFLPPRSLLIMSGESRYAWCHGITSKKMDLVDGARLERQRRVSVTFRKIRGVPCNCAFPFCCDSQKAPLMPSRIATAAEEQQQRNILCADDSTTRPRLEQDHVLGVYDSIASHFSSTRFAIWPTVKEFIDALEKGSIVADIGCGNGKYLGLRSDLVVMGCDSSIELVNLAARRLRTAGALGTHFSPDSLQIADVFVADALSLPFRHSCVDSAISIAVLHHISSEVRRFTFLSNIMDILKPGGRALITVWSTLREDPEKTIKKWKPLENGQEGDYFVPWHVPLHRAEALGLTKGDQKVDVAKNTVVFQRYYHLFTDEELVALSSKVKGARFISCIYDKSNWCLILQKI